MIGINNMTIDTTLEQPIRITVTHNEYYALLNLLEHEPKENIGLKQLVDKASPWNEMDNDK
jgi:uncharacterized protein (DUF1778 family)